MKHPTFAKVEIYPDGANVKYETALIYADSFADAAAQLEDYYGDILNKIIHLELFEESLITITNEETSKAIYKEMNWMFE